MSRTASLEQPIIRSFKKAPGIAKGVNNGSARIFNLDFRKEVRNETDEANPVVHHAVMEGIGIAHDRLEHDNLVDRLRSLCENLNLHIVNTVHHQFVPHGKSIVFVLEESHIAVHSWPERGYIHIDFVTCTKEELDSARLVSEFNAIFNPSGTRVLKLKY